LAALSKSLDQIDSLWFPSARMTLICPMAIWFVFTLTLSDVSRRLELGRRELVSALATGLLIAAVAGSASLRALQWHQRLGAIRSAGTAQGTLELARPERIYATCRDAHRAATQAGTTIVAFPFDGTATYACPALYPELITTFPSYERRYWILDALGTQNSERMIVWGADAELCTRRRLRKQFRQCEPVSDGHGLRLDYAPKPALSVLRALGYSIRPFGPGCHPEDVSTCRWWRQHFAPKG
jgi:hypothetical protein